MERGPAAKGISELLAKLAAAPERPLSGGWASGLRPGEIVGHFEILAELGRGGFGIVYEARDQRDGRAVAFKTVRPSQAARDTASEDWLLREAALAAKLSHPNIVTLHDHGEAEQGPYLVYELLRGETLDDRLHRGALPLAEALRVAVSVSEALEHAHVAGVIHRDLKPANVFLTAEGRVKVLDFGLAEVVYGMAGTRGGGTPAYMAPEQWREEPEDARTDVFAAATVLFESLTGRLPYRMVDGRSEVLDAREAPDPGVPGVPAALARLLRRGLSPDPEQRPRSGAAWHEALLRVERDSERRARRVARWRTARLALLPLALAAAAVAYYLSTGGPAAGAARRRVVLADIENLTGDGDFDGLSEMLGTALEQSRGLVPITRTRSRDLTTRAAADRSDPIDPSSAGDIARRVGAAAVLLTSARRFGDVYVLEVRAVDPTSARDLFAQKETARQKGAVPDAIDRLSDAVRRGLREATGSDAPRLSSGAMATRSLDAWRLYVLGRECAARLGQIEPCSRHFRQALSIDPAFPLAQYELAHTAFFENAPVAEQDAAVDAAMRSADRLPARERSILLAWRAHLQDDDAEALRLYGRLVERDPSDGEVSYLAGDLLYHQGAYEAAIPWFEKATAGPVPSDWALDHLVDSLHSAGRRDDLLRHCRDWSRLPPTPGVLHALSIGSGSTGDPGAALSAAQQELAIGGGPVALEDLAAALFQAGRMAEAEARLRELASLELPSAIEVRHALAVVLAAQGRRREGLAVWDAVGASALDSAAYRMLRGAYLVGDRDAGRVWREIEGVEWPPWSIPETAAGLAYLGDVDHALAMGRVAAPSEGRFHEAILAWRRGQVDEARRRLEDTIRSPEWRGGPLAFYRGEIALDAGRPLEALQLLDQYRTSYRRLPFGMNQSWMIPRSLYLMARAQQRLGERARARAVLDQLLALWKDADPGLPLLAEARGLRRELE